MNHDEWLGWMEYMCAEYLEGTDTPESKPYAYRRWIAGQEEPWIDQFDDIIFEISNETWNNLFRPGTFEVDMPDEEKPGITYTAGETYGMFHQYVIDVFKQSPYWEEKMEAKFKSVLGGWHNNNVSVKMHSKCRYSERKRL